jgi:hypothetical protein
VLKVFPGILILLTAIIFTGCQQPEEEIPDSQRTLTEQHGVEVAQIIETTRARFGSLEAREDPSVLSEILTGPYLDVFTPFSTEESSRTDASTIVSSVDIYGIRVYEYSSEEFKAIACGTFYADEVTSAGDLIEHRPPSDFRILYLFVRDDGIWKIALEVGLDSAYDDWVYAAEWERELVGDLNEYLYAECILDVP